MASRANEHGGNENAAPGTGAASCRIEAADRMQDLNASRNLVGGTSFELVTPAV
jgi:hypothetical protein